MVRYQESGRSESQAETPQEMSPILNAFNLLRSRVESNLARFEMLQSCVEDEITEKHKVLKALKVVEDYVAVSSTGISINQPR